MAHVEQYNMKLKYYEDSIETNKAHIRILTLIYFAIEGFDRNTKVPREEILINNIFNTIFSNLKQLESVFGQNDIKNFINLILKQQLDDTIFFENFSAIMNIIAVMGRCNIKMIFGNNRKCKQPFMHFTEQYNTDILLGYDCVEHKIFLFYVEQDFAVGRFKLTSNDKFDLRHAPPDVILDRFKKELASENPRRGIKIIGLFSKNCPQTNLHSPIYIKEGHSLLLGLEHFSNYIRSSSLTLVLTDSRTCVYLFNNMYSNKLRRIYNLGVKINLSFPNVKVLFIAGKQNHSDYLSRLGFGKQEFFAKTLTPIKVNKQILALKQGKILTFNDIYEFCIKNPELIEFSDAKLGQTNEDCMYLDVHCAHQPEKSLVNFVQMNRFNIFNNLLSRGNLIVHQTSEFGIGKYELMHGVSMMNNKPVLPQTLFAVVLRREHLLALHPGKKCLVENVCKIYFILNIPALKKLAEMITKNCIGCILNTIQKDNFNWGFFPLKEKGYLISIDYIVGFPSKFKNLLNVMDVYTRYCSPYIFKTRSAQNVITALSNYMAQHGSIKYLLSDNEFRGRDLKKFCLANNIQLMHSSPYKSRSRAHIENLNGLLSSGLKYLAQETQHTYENNLGLVGYLLNNKKFPNSELTPSILQNGYCASGFPDKVFRQDLAEITSKGFGTTLQEITELNAYLQQQEVNYTIQRQNEAKNRAIKKNLRRQPHKYKVGDIVLLKRKYMVADGIPTKLQSNYINVPYKIVQVKEYIIFVQSLDSTIILARAPADLKIIKGINMEEFKKLSLLTDQEFSDIKELLQTVTEQDLLQDIQQFSTSSPFNEGIVTRSKSKEKTEVYDQQTTLQLFLDDYMDDPIVNFDI